MAGILSHSRVPSAAVNDLQRQESKYANTLYIPLPFTAAPLNTHLLQHCVFGTSSHAYVPKFASPLWLAGERETFPCRHGVRGKMCARGDATSFTWVLLCFDRRWRLSLQLEPDVVLADAVQASHAARALPLPSDPRPPSLPSPPFPLPSQPRPASILSRESSPCQIAWWFSDVNRWD